MSRFFWCPCTAIDVVASVQFNGGVLLPDIMLLLSVDPMLLPLGNPFKCHEDALPLQPTMIPFNLITSVSTFFPRVECPQKV